MDSQDDGRTCERVLHDVGDFSSPGAFCVKGVAESQAEGDLTVTLTIQADDLAPFPDSVQG